VRGDGLADEALGLAAVEVVDGLVDAAAHVAEAVGGANDGVGAQVEQVALDHLDSADLGKLDREGGGDGGGAVAEAEAQRAGGGTERLERLHVPPAQPGAEGAEHTLRTPGGGAGFVCGASRVAPSPEDDAAGQ
jgi:hypothetical protein